MSKFSKISKICELKYVIIESRRRLAQFEIVLSKNEIIEGLIELLKSKKVNKVKDGFKI